MNQKSNQKTCLPNATRHPPATGGQTAARLDLLEPEGSYGSFVSPESYEMTGEIQLQTVYFNTAKLQI